MVRRCCCHKKEIYACRRRARLVVYCFYIQFLALAGGCDKVEIPQPDGVSSGGEAGTVWKPLDGTGEGTDTCPWSVADVLQNEFLPDVPVWAAGYVVGYVIGNSVKGSVFGAEEAVQSNVLIADNPEEKNVDACLPVELKTEKLHYGVSLRCNPDSLGHYVLFQAFVKTYFRAKGLREVKQYRWYGSRPYVPSPGQGDRPGDDEPQDETLRVEHAEEILHDGRAIRKIL